MASIMPPPRPKKNDKQGKPALKRLMIYAACVAASCGTAAFAGKADDTLNVAFPQEIEPLEYYKIAGREGMILAQHVYDGLLFKDITTGSIKPALAESYDYVDDTTIDLKIRTGVRFHDGTELTPEDVVYTLTTVSQPDYGARYGITVNWIAKVEAREGNIVRITMKEPFAGALEMLTDVLPIYPKARFAEGGSAGMAANPVGTGPYKLVEMTPGTRYVLARNEDYYAESPKGRPQIGTIVARTIPEQNTQYAELMSGALDWIWRVPPDQADKLGRMNGIEIVNGPILRFGYITMYAAGDYPTSELKVRQAISHAVNRQAITDAYSGGSSKVLDGPCNPAQFGCEGDFVKYDHDPEKARALLAEAGFPNGFDTVLYTGQFPQAVAEAVAGDLAAVGITAEIRNLQYSAASEAWRKGEVPMMLANWGSYGVADVAFSTSFFFDGSPDDGAHDTQVQEWLNVADTSIDPQVRLENYRKAMTRITEQAYWLPLYDFSVNYAVSADLSFQPSPDEFVRFYSASWK